MYWSHILSFVIINFILRSNCFAKNNKIMYIVVSLIIYLINTKSMDINLQNNDKFLYWFCTWQHRIHIWLDNQCIFSKIKIIIVHTFVPYILLISVSSFIGIFFCSNQITVDWRQAPAGRGGVLVIVLKGGPECMQTLINKKKINIRVDQKVHGGVC